MLLEQLEIVNFRQFYGTQSLEFSRSSSTNVTVIHGANGSGKTTLLNAFVWLFYDDVNLPRSDSIVTERAMAETEVNQSTSVSVELVFDHEGRRYTAKRSHIYRKTSSNDLSGDLIDEEVTLEYIDEDGNFKTRSNPNAALRQIMPERLRELFFFDGETIDELSAQGSQERIRSAIRNIMGLEILERSIRHLGDVEKRFENEIQQHGGSELQELIEDKQKLEDEINSKEHELENLRKSKSETEEDLHNVETRLSELEGSRELQERRDSLVSELQGVESDIDTIDADIAAVISDRGQLPFAMAAIEETARMLQEKRREGEIPSEIKTQFVEDLLELEECICGRPLTTGTDARVKVEQWRQRAGSSELEETAIRISGQLTEVGNEQESLYSDIEKHLDRRTEKRNRKEAIEEELDEISTQLSDIETEDIDQLEARRTSLSEDRDSFIETIGDVKGSLDELSDKLTELKSDINEAREENEIANLARRRAQAAAYVKDQLQNLFERYQDEVRDQVNARVNDIFQDIIEKEFYAEITEDYSMRILKDVGATEGLSVAKSTGERQVASLAFISTLVSLAKERYESDDDAVYFTGGIYPMVMDSPFGYLDPTYQTRVSRMLPKMASQVVILVTQSQWSEEVAAEMDHVAGKRYRLEYQDPREDPTTTYEYTDIVLEAGSA